MPPIGGRNTLRSGRVTSSGYMPPVCSNRQRRSAPSPTPNLSATPGSHQTGSTAILVTETSPASRWRSEEHTSELQSHSDLVCRLLLEKKKRQYPHPSAQTRRCPASPGVGHWHDLSHIA